MSQKGWGLPAGSCRRQDWAGTLNPDKPHSSYWLINLPFPPTGWPRIPFGLRLNSLHFISFPFFTLSFFLVLTFSSHESSYFFYSIFRKLSSHMFLLYSFHGISSMWLIPSSGWLLGGGFYIIFGLGIHFLPVSDSRDCLPKCPTVLISGAGKGQEKSHTDKWSQPGSRKSSYLHGRILLSEWWAKN